MFSDDIELVLAESPSLTTNVTPYIGQDSRRTDNDSPDSGAGLDVVKNIVIIPTPGPGCEFTQDSASPAYEWPGALIIAQARGTDVAYALAKAWHDRLSAVRNRAIGGTWYLRIRCRQLPFDLGPDAGTALAQIAFNVFAEKRPS